jgi:hypothetical protein
MQQRQKTAKETEPDRDFFHRDGSGLAIGEAISLNKIKKKRRIMCVLSHKVHDFFLLGDSAVWSCRLWDHWHKMSFEFKLVALTFSLVRLSPSAVRWYPHGDVRGPVQTH